jgi:signal transduction histidine kinase
MRTFSRQDNTVKTLFNIHEGIDSTLMILGHRLKGNPARPAIKVVKNYGDLPEIKCYSGQLNQVFMNLLSNAIEALEDSNIGHSFAEIASNPNCITIRTEVESVNRVIISIQDNGIGMSPLVQSRIFEPLFTTKAVNKGTGLGLSITRQIVEEKHGGTIRCNSTLGEGTEFVITIPQN